MGKKSIIIMSKYNIRAVIAFLRVCKKNNIDFHIIACGEDDPILKTEYINNVDDIRLDNDIDKLFSIITKIKQMHKLDKAYFIPTSEYLNRYLLINRKKLEESGIIIPLVKKALYEEISNKYTFRKMCQENNIPVTKKYNNIDDAVFPCILKPISYDNYAGKPILIEEKADYKDEYKGKFYIEEYLSGDSFYLLFYFKRNGEYLSYSQKNILQQPNGKSMIMAKTSKIHNKPIAYKYAKMLKENNYMGLIMIEVKEKDNEYYLIEANPRLWGPSQLTVDSNMMFFENYLKDMGFEIKNYDENIFADSTYFWEDGICDSLDKLKYYSYSSQELMKEYDKLKKNDIYNREDTRKLFIGSEYVKCKKK